MTDNEGVSRDPVVGHDPLRSHPMRRFMVEVVLDALLLFFIVLWWMIHTFGI